MSPYTVHMQSMENVRFFDTTKIIKTTFSYIYLLSPATKERRDIVFSRIGAMYIYLFVGVFVCVCVFVRLFGRFLLNALSYELHFLYIGTSP